MIQPFFDFIEKFVTDFSLKRLALLLSLMISVGTIYFFYEYQTSSSEISKYERSIVVLNKAIQIKSNDPKVEAVLQNVYSGLEDITSKVPNNNFKIKQEFKQAIAGGGIWFILGLFFVPALINKSKDDSGSIVSGFFLLSFISGFLGYLLPTQWSEWVVFGLYPIGFNLILLIIIVILGKKK